MAVVVVEVLLVDEVVMVVAVVASIEAAIVVDMTILPEGAIEEVTEDVRGDMHHIKNFPCLSANVCEHSFDDIWRMLKPPALPQRVFPGRKGTAQTFVVACVMEMVLFYHICISSFTCSAKKPFGYFSFCISHLSPNCTTAHLIGLMTTEEQFAYGRAEND